MDRVHVGDGDEVRRCVDGLDPARREPFGAQQQASRHLEAGIVPHRRQDREPLGAGCVAPGVLGRAGPGPTRGAGTKHHDRATFPLDGDELVRHRKPSSNPEVKKG